MDLYNEYSQKLNYSNASKLNDADSFGMVFNYNIDLDDRICYFDVEHGLARFIQQIRFLTNESGEPIVIFLVRDTMEQKMLDPSITYIKEIVESGVAMTLRYRYTVADDVVSKFIELFPGEKVIPENINVIKPTSKKQVL